MKKVSKKKSPKKVSKSKSYNILMYVENSEPKVKKFDTELEMGRFIDKFNKENPESEAMDSGYWTDFAVTGITGEVHFFTDGMTLE